MTKGEFTLDDFIAQMAQVGKLGPMGKVMGMIPGMGDMLEQVKMKEGDIERSLNRMRAMYDSMTPAERERPESIDPARRRRIAAGAGVTVRDVCRFLADFEQSRAVMRAVGAMGVRGKLKLMRSMRDADPVLGLVTERRWTRDPSWVHRRRDDRRTAAWWALAVAAAVVLAWACARLVR